METNLNLDPVQGTMDLQQAKHLLNRCMFGARHSEIIFMKGKTVDEAVDFLLRDPVDPLSKPIGVKESDLEVPVGTTWVDTKYNSKYRGERIYSYNNWWFLRLLKQDLSLQEKMVLFWHNHFVIENDVVRNTNYNYRYNLLLQEQALGNFKLLTEKMTIDTGMLNYLNGVENKTGSPNENYARELFELFTIGKGPLINEGNYTNYTEQDIREAAKVLTGWRTSSNTDSSYFTASRHDESEKIFSEIYDNHKISNTEEEEYKSLVEMIFGKAETARHIVRKFYRWFVYHHLDEEIEENIIDPLATLLIENNFEIKPVLKNLLCSQHFFDERFRGVIIKDPLQYTIGLLRQLEYEIPGNDDIRIRYGFGNVIRNQTVNIGMNLGNPPDVAGWPAWYLAPSFNQVWINTATIPSRSYFADLIVNKNIRPLAGVDTVSYDPFRAAYLTDNPSNINDLLQTITNLLLPKEATTDQLSELKEELIPGLPDFEWTIEWNKYVDNPDDENQKSAVGSRLKKMLTKICLMAEYQLI